MVKKEEKPPYAQSSIWYAGKELCFREEVKSINEAQSILDGYHAVGKMAAATHDLGKHQIYSDCKKK